MKATENRKAAEQWIADGKPCTSRYGLAYRGATATFIPTEKAKKLIASQSWQFGMGFYSLNWRTHEGVDVLEFNELSESDMY